MTNDISEEASMQIKVLKSDHARQHWRDLLDQIAAGEEMVIERYNKAVAAMIPIDIYLALQEEIEDLRLAPIARAELEEYRRDPSTARPYSEIRAELIEAGVLDAEAEI
jgi:antitoxin (DNA-binding transcriptional repressor) of toxin-antitoxin stability system